MINNKLIFVLDEYFGDVKIKKIDLKEISIKRIYNWTDCGLEMYKFKLQNPKSNDITIIAKPYNLYYNSRFITNYVIQIRNDKLFYWHKRNGKFDRKRYLLKTKIENKEFE